MPDTKAPEAPNPTQVPPQTPEGQARALALRQEQRVSVAENVDMTALLAREDKSLERIETIVTVPADFQYRIPMRGQKNPDGSWNNDAAKVGLTVDGYDYLNRVIGVSFFLPHEVADRDGKMQPNPIIRDDQIRMLMGAVWYTPLGQAVMHVEPVEVNYQLLWMNKRAHADSAVIVRNESGLGIAFDEFGQPAVKLSDADELKCLRELTQIRAFGPRYAITVGRVRLLKMASGLRSLPINYPTDFRVRVTAYRDRMTPQERIRSAGGDIRALYGTNPDNDPALAPLNQAEQEEAGVNEAIASEQGVIDETSAQESVTVQTKAPPAPPAAGKVEVKPATAPWTPDELDNLGLGGEPEPGA